jgi:hypothetical protein
VSMSMKGGNGGTRMVFSLRPHPKMLELFSLEKVLIRKQKREMRQIEREMTQSLPSLSHFVPISVSPFFEFSLQ